MRRCRVVVLAILSNYLAAQTWINHDSGVTASLRGVSAVNDRVVWASGSGGTVLWTRDGEHWEKLSVT